MSRALVQILMIAASTSTAIAQSNPIADLFKGLPGGSRKTIVMINIAHGVAQKCKIQFNRNSIFRIFEKQLRLRGENEEKIAKTRKAFVEFSKNYSITPSNEPKNSPCTASDRQFYNEIYKSMVAGEFQDR